MSPARIGWARCQNLGRLFILVPRMTKRKSTSGSTTLPQHYGITFKELIAGGLYVLCKLGQDATLCALTKSGKVETTDLYQQIYEAAGDIKPKNISIDTLSRAFAGNEIDRVQVYAFAMHMQALAMVASGSVTILSHPVPTRHRVGHRDPPVLPHGTVRFAFGNI